MDLRLTPENERFRVELLEWLASVERPAGLRDYGATPTRGDVVAGRAWQRLLADGGWACLPWPTEHGGRAATPLEQAIFAEELARASLPRQLNIVGPDLVGPVLIAFGTPDQQARFLPAIRNGDQLWCQLFSEPEAGSDLAALATRGERTDGGWIVSGQKIWTSAANSADMGLLLARTEAEPGHAGISCFLVPMDREGIEVRPLRQMDHETKFNEVFLDDVVVSDHELLGRPGQGWTIAVSTLGSERLALGSQAVALGHAVDELAAPGRPRDAVTTDRIVTLWSRVWLLRTTWFRALSSSGGLSNPTFSVLKLAASELQRDVARAGVDLAGVAAVAGEGPLGQAARLLASPGGTIAGGTSEIQRNILAERVLGLPRQA